MIIFAPWLAGQAIYIETNNMMKHLVGHLQFI